MSKVIKEFTREVAALYKAANSDIRKCDDLRAYLEANSSLIEESIYSNTYHTIRELINLVAGIKVEDLRFASAEVLQAEYKHILNGLKGDDTDRMIELLAQRAAMCWLRLMHAERVHTAIRGRSPAPYKDLEWADKQLNMAHNRFLRACESLAKVRAMLAAGRCARANAEIVEAKLAWINGGRAQTLKQLQEGGFKGKVVFGG